MMQKLQNKTHGFKMIFHILHLFKINLIQKYLKIETEEYKP